MKTSGSRGTSDQLKPAARTHHHEMVETLEFEIDMLNEEINQFEMYHPRMEAIMDRIEQAKGELKMHRGMMKRSHLRLV